MPEKLVSQNIEILNFRNRKSRNLEIWKKLKKKKIRKLKNRKSRNFRI